MTWLNETIPTLLLSIEGDSVKQTELNMKTLKGFLGEQDLNFSTMMVRGRADYKQAFAIPYLGPDYGHLPNYLFAAGQPTAYFVSEDRLVYEVDRDEGKTTLIGELVSQCPEDAIATTPFFYDVQDVQFYVAKDFG